ncbi:25055_t:CDS:2, partial [Gigaspora rosea]
ASNMEYIEQKSVPDYEENVDNEFFTRRSKRRDIANEHDSDHATSSIPESNTSTNQSSKPNLKDLQLVPIDIVPGKSWIWGYNQLYKPVQPYKRIVRCLFKINGTNGLQPYWVKVKT